MKHTLLATALLGVVAFTSVTTQAETASWLGRTYTWTDASGQQRTATYADKATTPEQVWGLVYSIYTDQSVPGTKAVVTDYNAEGQPVMDAVRYTPLPASALNGKPTVNGGNSGAGASDYTPQEEGTTALLVKCRNEFVQATGSYPQQMKLIESVQVISSAVRVGGDNPGTLLNIDDDLNKFFVIIKGKPRHLSYYPQPFYRMYEELSPTETSFGPTSQYAFRRMTGYTDASGVYHQPEHFPLLHDCASVFGMGHPCMMQGVGPDYGDTPTVHANLMIYIPDKRFYQPWNGGNEKNTFYNGTTYQPYFFTYSIAQAAPAVAADAAVENMMDVTLDWTSSLKTITQDAQSPEEFRVLRRVKGDAEWVVMPSTAFTIAQEGTTVDARSTQLVDRGADGHVYLTVQEPMHPDNLEVEYMIEGRLKDSGFKMIQSNVQTAYIPGYGIYTEPRLRITDSHRSVYDSQTQRNAYTDQVAMTLSLDPEDVPMLRGHLSVDAASPTRLRLVRFAPGQSNSVPEAGTLVADVTITRADAPDADGWYAYAVSGTSCGAPYTATLYSPYVDNPTASLDKPLQDVREARDATYKSALLRFTDTWGVSTAEVADNNTYQYRVFATNLNLAKYTDGEIYSDLASAICRTVPIEADYVSYSLEEVKADVDRRLQPSASVVRFGLYDWPQVSRADVRAIGSQEDGDAILAYISRSVQTGDYTYMSRWSAPTQEFERQTPATASAAGMTQYEAQRVLLGKQLEMVTTLIDGSTYGAPRVQVRQMPTVTVSGTADYDPQLEMMTINGVWDWTAPDDAASADFTRLGWRGWAGQSKDSYDAAPFYDGLSATPAPASHRAPTTANAAADHVESSDTFSRTITPGNPGVVFTFLRHYSDSPWNPEEGRYIVTQGYGGWAKDYNGTTTGVDGLQQQDGVEAPVQWYTIQGQILRDAPTVPGIYLRRQNGKTVKVRI